jgi:hypothetical protein
VVTSGSERPGAVKLGEGLDVGDVDKKHRAQPGDSHALA